MEREQLMLIAEGGEAWRGAWREIPIRTRIRWGNRPGKAPPEIDPPLAAALVLGQMSYKQQIMFLWVFPITFFVPITRGYGDPGALGWLVPLLAPFAAFGVVRFVERLGADRVARERERLYAVIDAWMDYRSQPV